MPSYELKHPHHTTADEALNIIKTNIDEYGYGGYVKWKDHKVSVSIGPFGTLLNIKGAITDSEIIINCSQRSP